MELQKQILPGFPPRQFQSLSDTRWACRVVSCRNIRDSLQALVKTLRQIADEPNSGRAIEARGLIAVIDLKSVLILYVYCDLLGKIQGVSL